MNERQVAIGEMGGRGEGLWDGVPMPMLFRMALERAETMDDAVAVFRDHPRTCEYYYVVSDGKIPDARGLYCRPDVFEVVRPGQTVPGKLADAVKDAVVFSGHSRLKVLLKRIRAEYGAIDAEKAIRLMDRPAAMKSNLHNALFAPQSLEMWVAHAAEPLPGTKYQACWQQYEHYDLARWFKRLAELASVQRGHVPATAERAMGPADNGPMRKQLNRYQTPSTGFDWTLRPGEGFAGRSTWTVNFPSPYRSPVEQNNTVWCEYFPAVGGSDRPRPGVVVLHIAGGNFFVARMISNSLSGNGIHALFMKMPYYGQRRPSGYRKIHGSDASLDELRKSVTQAVMDIRRSASWLASRPEVDAAKVGLCGVSLGGFAAALAGGVDGRFPRVAVILAGGDLAQVVMSGQREVRSLRRMIDRDGMTADQVRAFLRPIDPLQFAARLRSSEVLMINARRDPLVTQGSARTLAEAAGADLTWYDADHYSMIRYLPMAMDRVVKFFQAPWAAGSAEPAVASP